MLKSALAARTKLLYPEVEREKKRIKKKLLKKSSNKYIGKLLKKRVMSIRKI
jgi:hypothetical protein